MTTLARACCMLVVINSASGCRPKVKESTPDAGDAGTVVASDDRVDRATDRRNTKELMEILAAATEPPPRETRRRIVRGLARIADEASSTPLLRALSDEDDETVAWAAYGLGYACKPHADLHVRALAARAVTWARTRTDAGASSPLDVAFAIARALGRCATPAAEQTLATFVKNRGPFSESAAYALGDVATRRAPLTDESITTLLDAAAPAAGREREPLRSALFAFARMTSIPETFRQRVVDAARASLSTPGDTRIFAVRALARAGLAPDTLANVAADRAYSLAERVEAARGLAQSGARGPRSAAEVLVKLTQAGGLATMVTTPEIFVIGALIESTRDEKKDQVDAAGFEKALYALAAVPMPEDRSTPLARRVEDLRCNAAAALARGTFGSDVLRACADPKSEAAQQSTLRSVLAGPLTGARRAAWSKLALSEHVRVREAALESAKAHPELGPAIAAPIADALRSKRAGLVATAAEVVHAHPTRFFAEDGRGLTAELSTSLSAALAEPWSEDLIETKAALLDAAVAVGHSKAKDVARAACSSDNATLRQRGLKAMASVGEDPAKCAAREPEPAKELDALLARATSIVFDVAGKPLTIKVDPGVAPVTATRLVSLARAGFFRGIVIHRVVPAFVVQLGDPGGDGYGGSGKSLRCETSPIPFHPLSVGMALAGRDTGSSQFFVTLARTPHLDGDYAWVGRAEGDWANVVQGDVVDAVRVID